VAATPQPTYHLLVHNENASMWMRSFWNNHIDSIWNNPDQLHQIRGQTFWMFHLKTSNLEVSHATNTNTRPSVSIHSMHFVFPFCPMGAGSVIVIPISKNSWKTEATLFSDFSSFLPLRVNSGRVFNPESILWEFFNIKFTLGNLIPRSNSSVLDRGFAEFIFPNATFLPRRDKTCFCCKLKLTASCPSSIGSIEYFNTSDRYHPHYFEFPLLELNEAELSIFLSTHKDQYTFLSCGDPSYDPPDFLALFMPFTKTMWVLIFMTIFGWPIVLSLVENDFNFNKVLKDFDALFIVWAMILEQSHLRATNYKGRGPLYCYCGCVLLAILILSNAYKGDNIKTLTKSFELVPLTHMEHVISAGYKKYTTRICFSSVIECFTGQFYSEATQSVNQYTEKQYEIWKPLDYLNKEVIEHYEDQLKFEWFGECREKKALLGWRTEDNFVGLERKLRRKHKSAHVSLGEEFIFSRRLGLRLDRYGSIKVLKRMWTLVESGVHNELLNISYKPPIANPIQPRRLAIHGNIFVQFVFLSCGLLFGLLIFVAEFHMSVTLYFYSVRNSVGFIIKNVLQHSQKAFQLGVKKFLNIRGQLLNQRPLG